MKTADNAPIVGKVEHPAGTIFWREIPDPTYNFRVEIDLNELRTRIDAFTAAALAASRKEIDDLNEQIKDCKWDDHADGDIVRAQERQLKDYETVVMHLKMELAASHAKGVEEGRREAEDKQCGWTPIAGTMIADQPQWQTGCGNTVVAISDEGYRYCPFCRGRIAALPSPGEKEYNPQNVNDPDLPRQFAL